MGRYKRKSDRQSWSASNMEKAIEALRSHKMGLKTACRMFCVPRYKSTSDSQQAAKKGLGSKSNVFDAALEYELVTHIKSMESMLFGFTPRRLRQVAYQLAVANGIHDRFNNKKKEASKEWYRGFMSRHPDLSLRMPEPTSAAWARGFNEVAVGKFFDLL